MIIHDVEQGSDEWKRLRLSIPTASQFDKIVTPTGRLSKQADALMYRLAAQHFLQRDLTEIGNLYWVNRGRDLEESGALAYEFARGVETKRVGFITTNDGRIGASPDRLVIGQPGAVEMKCPAPATHIGYLIHGFGPDYYCQAQGQMLVGEFAWVDLVSYYPGFPLVIERFERDEEFINTLRDALNKFCIELAAMILRLEEMGAQILNAPEV